MVEVFLAKIGIKQENPYKSRDFLEPKTKIYETFKLQQNFFCCKVIMIRTDAKIRVFLKHESI
jgi:hypothetical protein